MNKECVFSEGKAMNRVALSCHTVLAAVLAIQLLVLHILNLMVLISGYPFLSHVHQMALYPKLKFCIRNC